MGCNFDDDEPTKRDYEDLEKRFHDKQVRLIEARAIISELVCKEMVYTLNNKGDPFRNPDIKRAAKFLLEND